MSRFREQVQARTTEAVPHRLVSMAIFGQERMVRQLLTPLIDLPSGSSSVVQQVLKVCLKRAVPKHGDLAHDSALPMGSIRSATPTEGWTTSGKPFVLPEPSSGSVRPVGRQ